ncbi:MAG: site-2 protease family protein [Candidatus Thermoplasmatota archaeon]|nr:site-2 protease family protein [Candidatus Thermoplasmatota archaeon]
MNGYLIALVVFLAWLGFILYLRRSKVLERHSMSLYGPMIMWRTLRGRAFIDKVASKKLFWNFYGRLSLWVCASSMMLIMLLLLWEATIVPQIERAPSPELILGIPGINPVIPLGYGVLALIVAIVVHELAHGILARSGDIKVQSLGLVFLVFPIGAFMEPDEKELQATTRRKRSKVFAAGPATNILLALVILGLFSGVMMSSAEPVNDGALAVGVVDGSPLGRAGIVPTSLIVSVAGQTVTSASDLEDNSYAAPGSEVAVDYYYKGELRSVDALYGIVVAYAVEDFAAYTAGFRTGMVLVSLNGMQLATTSDLSGVMSGLSAGQVVPVTVMSYSQTDDGFVIDGSITSVVLSDKWDYYDEHLPSENEESYRGVGYLGGGFLNLGIRTQDADYYASMLAHPFDGNKDLSDFSMSWLRLVALPFLDLAPIRSPVTDLYEPGGSLAWMPDSAFWLLTNSLYWIFWLNLMVGLTNVLPAVPLDGGYLFRDALDFLVDRSGTKYTKEKRDRLVGSISIGLALLVLSLILWQLVGPSL